MSRLPIRIRLTLVFALVMALVLAGFGAFVYLRLQSSLDEQLEERLTASAAAIAALVRQGDPAADPGGLVGDDEFAQVIGADGTVLAATSPAGVDPLLSTEGVSAARSGPVAVERVEVAGVDGGEARLLAIPVDRADGATVVLVGASLEDRDDALGGLLTQLVIGGPIVLLLASLAGYGLAAAALRPVERMRERAAEISAETPGERLPLPQARDELYRLGETLNAMLGRLEAGLERERRFVAEASHELRTPLAALQAELELALRRPRTAEELESALRSAADEADRVARLAEDLLVLARADEGALALRRSEIPARDLLEGVARRFSARAEPTGRTLDIASDDGTLVLGDRLRLEQALGNLVDNALRHGGGGVLLEASVDNGSIALRVSDEGPGFPSELLPVAFERFSRTNEARTEGSAGLGLAIVDAIARAHGGSVTAANRPAGGAEVTISLPVDSPTR
jgi:heavy metal sensor kinase